MGRKSYSNAAVTPSRKAKWSGTWLPRSTWRKYLSFGQLIPQFRKSDFPLTCQSIKCGLGEKLFNPQVDMHQLFVDDGWQDKAIREQFIYAAA